jgi:hypothetical protein
LKTRPLVFAAECLAALALAAAGAWIADRVNHKRNRDSQSFERGAAALERMAYASEHHGLPRPSMLPAADRGIKIITVPTPEPDPCLSITRPRGNTYYSKSCGVTLPTLGGTARE